MITRELQHLDTILIEFCSPLLTFLGICQVNKHIKILLRVGLFHLLILESFIIQFFCNLLTIFYLLKRMTRIVMVRNVLWNQDWFKVLKFQFSFGIVDYFVNLELTVSVGWCKIDISKTLMLPIWKRRYFNDVF